VVPVPVPVPVGQAGITQQAIALQVQLLVVGLAAVADECGHDKSAHGTVPSGGRQLASINAARMRRASNLWQRSQGWPLSPIRILTTSSATAIGGAPASYAAEVSASIISPRINVFSCCSGANRAGSFGPGGAR
jgi:hypothetical protein